MSINVINHQPKRNKSRLTDIGPSWRRALEQKNIQLANGIRGSQASFGTVYRQLDERQRDEVFGPSQLPEDDRWLNKPNVKFDPTYGRVNNDGSMMTNKHVNLMDIEDQTLMESPHSHLKHLNKKYIDMSGAKVNIFKAGEQSIVNQQFKFPNARNVFLPLLNTSV